MKDVASCILSRSSPRMLKDYCLARPKKTDGVRKYKDCRGKTLLTGYHLVYCPPQGLQISTHVPFKGLYARFWSLVSNWVSTLSTPSPLTILGLMNIL